MQILPAHPTGVLDVGRLCGRTNRASLRIIAHKVSFFDAIKLIVNFFL